MPQKRWRKFPRLEENPTSAKVIAQSAANEDERGEK